MADGGDKAALARLQGVRKRFGETQTSMAARKLARMG